MYACSNCRIVVDTDFSAVTVINADPFAYL